MTDDQNVGAVLGLILAVVLLVIWTIGDRDGNQ